MKILVPMSRSQDVLPLINMGAEEFYCGLNLDWDQKYHIINSINRRYFKNANFKSINDLSRAASVINQHKAALFLTLNAPYYIPEQYHLLRKYIKKMVNVGITGFIISDIYLMKYVRNTYPHIRIHASTVAAGINIETIRFFVDLKINRIVLPRELTPGEILDIRQNTDVELEVFYSPLGCSGIDGYCGYQHIHEGNAGGSACINHDLRSFHHYCDMDKKLSNIPMHDCRLCQVYDLYKGNIDSIKIIGRGDPLLSLKKKIILLKKMVEFIERKRQLTKKEFCELVIQKIVKKSSFQCDTKQCLYREG